MSSVGTSGSASVGVISSEKNKRKNTQGNRTDAGWEHGIEIDAKSKRVKCKYCEVVRFGGVFRLKHHLARTSQNVEPCPKVPQDVREKFIEILMSKADQTMQKKQKIIGSMEDFLPEEVQRGQRTMDSFVVKSRNQGTLNQIFKKEERERVCQQIAKFFYTSAIPFNVVNNPEFAKMLDMVAKYGVGLKLPSYNDIREKFLKKEVSRTLDILEEYKKEWKETGCTIMSDGWTDRKRRSICNFLVNSPKGTVFLSSLDTSDISKTADKVCEMLDEIIEKVGEENVVQVVTDNASNYKLAGEMLMEKRKHLYWTPCAAHCIDLILEDFEKKMTVHKVTIAKGRSITTYIYSRTMVIAWMKKFTKGKDLIRPAITRFATTYLTLGCLNENKGALMSMFSSTTWKSSKFAASPQGKKIQSIVLDGRGFWPAVITCLKAAAPLIKVLRMVDSDASPAMGFIYEAMDRAKEQIQANFKNVKKSYDPIWEIIDRRWENQLHRPLHAAAFYLNPQFVYASNFKADAEVKIGFYNCLQRMVPDVNERATIDLQAESFRRKRGLFGMDTAQINVKKFAPAEWWEAYGDECPELKRFAVRILSLTCSSSGCERNWSAFEMVHSKRRNRLRQEKMNDLVFVMYNLKLKQRHGKREASQRGLISLDEIPSDDEWITEKEDPVLPANGDWLNVLDRVAMRSLEVEENSDKEERDEGDDGDDEDNTRVICDEDLGMRNINLEVDLDEDEDIVGDDDDAWFYEERELHEFHVNDVELEENDVTVNVDVDN